MSIINIYLEDLTLKGIMAQASPRSGTCLDVFVLGEALAVVPGADRLCLLAETILSSPDDIGEVVGWTNGLKRGVVRMADRGLEIRRASVPVPGASVGERASVPMPAAIGVLRTR